MTLQEGLEIIKNMNFDEMIKACPKSRREHSWFLSDFDCKNDGYLGYRTEITSQFAEYLLENYKNDTLDNLAHLPDAT